MKYDRILGIDPSGSYNEGKGVTGLCTLVTPISKIGYTGYIRAIDHANPMEYYQAHLDWIQSQIDYYGADKIVVSMEDYIIYNSQAKAHINTHLETSQLIGIIKFFCYQKGVDLLIRPAVAVKARFSDEILEHLGYITKIDGAWYNAGKNGHKLNNHEMDAIRHAVYTQKFENDCEPEPEPEEDTVLPVLEKAPPLNRHNPTKNEYDNLTKLKKILRLFEDSKIPSLIVPEELHTGYKNATTVAHAVRRYSKANDLNYIVQERRGKVYVYKQSEAE